MFGHSAEGGGTQTKSGNRGPSKLAERGCRSEVLQSKRAAATSPVEAEERLVLLCSDLR